MNDVVNSFRPRLGIIISMFPELHETFILRELVALERRGVRFDIYSLQYPRDPITLDDAIRLSTERTTYSGLITLSSLNALFRTIFRHPVKLLRAVGHVVFIGRDRPIDIIKNLAILPLALYIGEHGRSRGIVHWHGHWSNIPTTACWYLQQIMGERWSAAIHGEDIFSANRFLQYKLNDAQFSVVCSGYFCNYMKNSMGLRDPSKIHLNYHGLDPRVTQRADGRSFKLRSPDSVFQIVSIGRLVPTKGHDVLIKACAILINQGRNLHLQLIGAGPDKDALESLARREGIGASVTFRGALPFEKVLQTLEVADLFCLAPRMIPGHPPDGIPNVIAEAMALHIPVVTTRIGAIPELISDEVTGKLVEAEDVRAFARSIALVMDHPATARQLSDAAASRVAKLFNQTTNIDELLELFERYVPECLVESTCSSK